MSRSGRMIAGLLIPLAGFAAAEPGKTLVYTEAPGYRGDAWIEGGERFPQGARIVIEGAVARRALAPDFHASADPEVSFDGRKILFAGKRGAGDPWQIWEASLHGAAPRRLTQFRGAAILPHYLPDGRIVYARRHSDGYRIESLASGGEPQRLTYAPGNFVPYQVLRDGRVLFGGPHGSGVAEIFTMYSDGSGVESVRCDHGASRFDAWQDAAGDIVFRVNGGLARFTSASAGQVVIAAPQAPRKLQQSVIAPRTVPRLHPSALHNRDGAHLLCLNVYESKDHIPPGRASSVRVLTLGRGGEPHLLGTAPVEEDGSFYIRVPSEQPLRIEIEGPEGQKVAAERGWFWMRRGEQRICVGCHAGPERAPENAVPKILLRSTKPADLMPASGGTQ